MCQIERWPLETPSDCDFFGLCAVGLAGESTRVSIVGVLATYRERSGRVGWMMKRVWSMVCGAWLRERC